MAKMEKVVKNEEQNVSRGVEVNFIVMARIIESRLTVSSQTLAFHKPSLLAQLQR